MKRKIWLMLSMVLLFSLVLTGCGKTPSPESTNSQSNISSSEESYMPVPLDPPELSEELERQIKEDYLVFIKEKWLEDEIQCLITEDIEVTKYAGIYNDAIVITIAHPGVVYIPEGTQMTVAGHIIYYGRNGETLYVYKDSEFVNIGTAHYTKKWLTENDVRNIKWYMNGQ